jgi:two-component system invasion response regulator UvrY
MRRILVVDDSLEIRRSVRAVLADLVADVAFGEAAGAQEALAAVSREPWDLVLLDVSLPDRSGLETLREIRRLRPALAVLIMSFHPAAEYEAAARAHGATGYVTKGSSPEAIADAVNAALGSPPTATR